MNGTEIHWLSILYWTIGSTVAFVIGFVVVSACRLSSQISRDEEDSELRASFERINRAA